MCRIDVHASLKSALALLAAPVLVEATIWDSDPFNQWGVDLANRLATELPPLVDGRTAAQARDGFTIGLVSNFRPLIGSGDA